MRGCPLLQIAEGGLFFYCLIERHPFWCYTVGESKAGCKETGFVGNLSGDEFYGDSLLPATLQNTLRQLSHQRLPVGSPLARYNEVGILYLIVEPDEVEQ